MKKLLTLLLFACIFVTGCDKNSLKDAQSKLETAHNYTASIVVSIKGDFEKNDITYRTRNKVTIDRITGTAKINADITTNNETRSETYYIKTDKDNATTYKKVDGIYNATTEKKDQNSLYYITAFINENSEVLRKEHIDNKTCYVIVLKKDRIASFLSSYYDVSFINKDKISVTDDALIYIHVDKNNNIESIEADFTEIVKYNNKSLERFYLLIDYVSFNENDEVKIPSQILENSVDEKVLSINLS